MKKNNYLKRIIFATFCCVSISIFAASEATQVADSTQFATAYNIMKTTGGGVIELTADITLRLALNEVYVLGSNTSNPIEINTGTFKLIANGPGGATSESSPVLEVSDNMYIHGTATVLQAMARAKIRVAGGLVKTITTTAGAAALEANQGWVYVSGGKVSVEASVPTLAFAVLGGNFMNVVVTGGTIEAIGDNTRALRVSDGTATISDATITANGNGAYAMLSLGVNVMTIGDNTTVTTTSTNGSDAGLVSGGATSRIVIPSTSANVSITSSMKYKLDNAAAAVLDLRPTLVVTANPVDGSTMTYPNNNITLTASGNESMTLSGMYYSFGANPTTSSMWIASGGTIQAPSASTVIKLAIGKNGTIDSNIFTFNYTVNDIPADAVVNISSFAELQTAYANSQIGSPRTTKMKLLANIVVNAAFSMTPAVNYPVQIDADGKLIQGVNSASTHIVNYGGNLSITSTSNTGIFQLLGQATTNITGGTYTLNGNGSIIFANTGSGINVATTKINLSDATFIVNGTTNAQSIVKFVTSDGNLISATNCNFTLGAKAVAFNCVGPQYINIKNCTMTFNGNDAASIAFSQAPTNAVDKSDLSIDGLILNMTAGNVFNWGGNKKISTIIKDLTLNGSATIAKPAGGTGTLKVFYDFRAFTPSVDIAQGSYMTTQTVTPSLIPTSVLPVDAVGATMVYTVDGTDPVVTSTAYSAPIVINSTTTLKVAAIKDGFVGKSSSFTYTIGSTVDVNPEYKLISVYPTTVDKVLYTNITADGVVVVDLAGKMVLSKENVQNVDLSTLLSGVYFVKINTEGITKVFKIIKK